MIREPSAKLRVKSYRDVLVLLAPATFCQHWIMLILLSAALWCGCRPLLGGDIHKAIEDGDVAALRKIVKARPKAVNEPDEFGDSPLHMAALRGDAEVVALLLKGGADVNARDDKGQTPLFSTLLFTEPKGRKKTVELLLQAEARVNVSNRGGQTPLHFASHMEPDETIALDMVKLLLKKGAKVNALDAYGQTPFHLAAALGYADVVSILLAKGADPNLWDKRGRTPVRAALTSDFQEGRASLEGFAQTVRMGPIHSQAAKGNLPEVKRLLKDHSASLEARDAMRWTPLHWAVWYGRTTVVRVLLNAGAKPYWPDTGDLTALSLAACRGNGEIARLLLEEGAFAHASGADRWHPLHFASRWGSLEVAKVLVAYGARLDEPNSDGRTSLHLAARYGHRKVAAFLLEKGATLNARDLKASTPLHQALWMEHFGVAGLLVGKGADVNAREDSGYVPLHRALMSREDLDIIQRLLEAGANPNVNTYGVGTWRVIGDGTDPIPIPQKGFSVLELASSRQAVELLIKHGADVNIRGYEGRTALHVAVLRARKETAAALLAAGADVNIEDKHGHTPLFYARKGGHDQIVRLLKEHGAAK